MGIKSVLVQEDSMENGSLCQKPIFLPSERENVARKYLFILI